MSSPELNPIIVTASIPDTPYLKPPLKGNGGIGVTMSSRDWDGLMRSPLETLQKWVEEQVVVLRRDLEKLSGVAPKRSAGGGKDIMAKVFAIAEEAVCRSTEVREDLQGVTGDVTGMCDRVQSLFDMINDLKERVATPDVVNSGIHDELFLIEDGARSRSDANKAECLDLHNMVSDVKDRLRSVEASVLSMRKDRDDVMGRLTAMKSGRIREKADLDHALRTVGKLERRIKDLEAQSREAEIIKRNVKSMGKAIHDILNDMGRMSSSSRTTRSSPPRKVTRQPLSVRKKKKNKNNSDGDGQIQQQPPEFTWDNPDAQEIRDREIDELFEESGDRDPGSDPLSSGQGDAFPAGGTLEDEISYGEIVEASLPRTSRTFDRARQRVAEEKHERDVDKALMSSLQASGSVRERKRPRSRSRGGQAGGKRRGGTPGRPMSRISKPTGREAKRKTAVTKRTAQGRSKRPRRGSGGGGGGGSSYSGDRDWDRNWKDDDADRGGVRTFGPTGYKGGSWRGI